MMVNILFIWSKENKDISYKQGMNEILAVILYGFYPFYFKNNSKVSSEKLIENIKNNDNCQKEVYYFFHDYDEFPADLYVVFNNMMTKGIRDLYDNNLRAKKDQINFKKQELFKQQWTDEDGDEKVKRKYIKLNIYN
jgi:hypothetical protein